MTGSSVTCLEHVEHDGLSCFTMIFLSLLFFAIPPFLHESRISDILYLMKHAMTPVILLCFISLGAVTCVDLSICPCLLFFSVCVPFLTIGLLTTMQMSDMAAVSVISQHEQQQQHELCYSTAS